MTINARARGLADRTVAPIARGLVAVGATANVITVTGLLIALVGCGIVIAGMPVTGAVVIAFGSILDAFDGAVARLRGTQGPGGSFLDSVSDRIGDGAVMGTLVWLVREDAALVGVAVVALVAALLTSYVRAKAEAVGWSASVGLVERAERVIIALIAIAFDLLAIGVWVLATAGVITVTQRLVVVARQAREAARA